MFRRETGPRGVPDACPNPIVYSGEDSGIDSCVHSWPATAAQPRAAVPTSARPLPHSRGRLCLRPQGHRRTAEGGCAYVRKATAAQPRAAVPTSARPLPHSRGRLCLRPQGHRRTAEGGCAYVRKAMAAQPRAAVPTSARPLPHSRGRLCLRRKGEHKHGRRSRGPANSIAFCLLLRRTRR
jgi:hypothetical protein